MKHVTKKGENYYSTGHSKRKQCCMGQLVENKTQGYHLKRRPYVDVEINQLLCNVATNKIHESYCSLFWSVIFITLKLMTLCLNFHSFVFK